MAKKIDKLTPQQEKDLVKFRDEWLAHGLSTAPADFDAAIEVITDFYQRIGKKKPRFYCLQSPNECVLKMKELYGSDVKQYLGNTFFGQHESYWISYYLFAQQIGVKYAPEDSKILDSWATISKSINWWTPFDDACFLSDRPRVVKFDNERRLHREDGPAVQYSDGWGVCMWHGTRIPREWILNKANLTPKIALTWSNIEQRRAACEILGWANILRTLNAVTIDKDPDPEVGELVQVDIPELGREMFLRVQCGTGREFALPVPPDMRTALQANAWTFDIPEDMVKNIEVRT